MAAGGGTFEMGGVFSKNVTLDPGANATLKIDHAADFRGTVTGFNGNDLLDLQILLSAAIRHLAIWPTARTPAEL